MVQLINNYSVKVVCILNQADIQEDTIVDESCKISEEQLERRRSCLLAISHDLHRVDREVYEFCEVFSSSSEDIADATQNFLENLQGIYPQSILSRRGVESDKSAGKL